MKDEDINMDERALYSEIERHMVKGIMFHNDMSDYFNFIGLHGFKRIHEYQFYDEEIGRRKLCRKVLDMHNILIPHNKVEIEKYIPDDWYNYTRMDIDDSVIPKFVKNAWMMYKHWEEETKDLYTGIAYAFYEKGMLCDYELIKEYLHDVQIELKKIYRMCERLNIIAYDVVGISEMQDKIHDEYKSKLKNLEIS